MGYTAGWRLSLFLWAFFSAARESVSGKFGLIRLEKGEIFWRKTLTLFIELQRTKHNSTIKYPWAAELRTYPFVLEVRINFWESLHTFYGFNFFSQTVIDFYFHLKHYSILRALKRDLKLDILITVSRNTFLFAQRGGNSNCEVIYACKHFSIKMRNESKRDFKSHALKR